MTDLYNRIMLKDHLLPSYFINTREQDFKSMCQVDSGLLLSTTLHSPVK